MCTGYADNQLIATGDNCEVSGRDQSPETSISAHYRDHNAHYRITAPCVVSCFLILQHDMLCNVKECHQLGKLEFI